jgi:hypothetical protein
MHLSLKPFIAFLCVLAAGLSIGLAKPSKRPVVAAVVGIPLMLGAGAALRGYATDRVQRVRVAASKSRGAEATLAIPDVENFLRRVPELCSAFRRMAQSTAGFEPRTLRQLERFALKHGESVELDGPEFLEWVAAYGEAVRVARAGRWSVARVIGRGEPVVVSGRLPYFRYRVLLEAYQLLDAASEFRAQ